MGSGCVVATKFLNEFYAAPQMQISLLMICASYYTNWDLMKEFGVVIIFSRRKV